MKDALQFRESRPEGVTTCTIHESIETVANRLVKAEVSTQTVFGLKGSPDSSHFIFEINVGNIRIRHRMSLK